MNDPRKKRVGIIAPRGFSKSTLKIDDCLKAIVTAKEPELIAFVSESEDQAIYDLEAIKTNLEENELLRQAYGDLVGFAVWGKKRIQTTNNCTLIAKGTRQKMRGIKTKVRYTRVYLDDFESENNTLTPEQRDKIKAWVLAAVLPSLDRYRGKVIAIGTIVHEDSYLSSIRTDAAWTTLYYQSIKKDGEALWPERFPVKYLEKEKETYKNQGKLDLWYQEYQNEPISAENRKIHPRYHEEMIYEADGDWHTKDSRLGITVGVDFGRLHDRTSFVVLGWDSQSGYEIETRAGLFPLNEIVDMFFELNDIYSPRLFVMDEVGLQVLIKDALYHRMRTENNHFSVVGWKAPPGFHRGETEGAKWGLLALESKFQSGSLYIKRQSPISEEALTFPRGKYDDCLDALHLASLYPSRPFKTETSSRKTIRFKHATHWMVA